jgi:hypothetical protein
VIVYLITEIEGPIKKEEYKEDTNMMMVQTGSEFESSKSKLEEVMGENLELRNNINQMDKLVNDRDREARGLRKQIEHFE